MSCRTTYDFISSEFRKVRILPKRHGIKPSAQSSPQKETLPNTSKRPVESRNCTLPTLSYFRSLPILAKDPLKI